MALKRDSTCNISTLAIIMALSTNLALANFMTLLSNFFDAPSCTCHCPGVCHGLCGRVGLLDGQRTKHGGDTQMMTPRY